MADTCTKHAPLVWRRQETRDADRIASRNPASEMLVASGFMGLARWIGVCPKCDTPLAWSSDKPAAALPRGGTDADA